MIDDERYGELLARALVDDERPGFRDGLRARLLARVASVAAERAARSRRRWLLRPLAVAAAALALAFGATGYAAASSLPGEPAFAVKRAVEELVFALATDDAARVERLVAQAEARLAELRRAPVESAASAGALAEYAGALDRLAALVERLRHAPPGGRRDDALALAAGAARAHLAALESLRASAPAEALPGVERAIEAGRRVEGSLPPVRPEPSAPSAAPSGAPRPQPSTPRPGGAPAASPPGASASDPVRGAPPSPRR